MPVFVGAGGTFDSKVSGGGQGISIGTTDTTGRDAGVSTAQGTFIYNVTTDAFEGYTGNQWVTVKSNVIPGTFIAETTFAVDPGAPQPYPIPGSAVQLDIYVFGAGGGSRGPSTGGGGGFAQATIPVASIGSNTLTVVSGEGGPDSNPSSGAFGGGGGTGPGGQSAGGGGYSGVFDGPSVTQPAAIIIAGGGGGGG